MRRRWLLIADAPVLGWLIAAAVCGFTDLAPESRLWLLTHITLLGAAGTAILVWSQHFTTALLRLRDASHTWESARLVLFNLATISLLIGTSVDNNAVAIVGGALVIAVFMWHFVVLVKQLRAALPARFVVSVHYYIVATALVVCGSAIGIALTSGRATEPADARWNVAHMLFNVEGWLAATILGTLVTFWPTLLGTQVVAGGVKVARRMLPSLAFATIVAALGAGLGVRVIEAGGQFGYVVALCVSLVPYVREIRTRARFNFASLSVLASQIWLVAWSILVLLWMITESSPNELERRVMDSIPLLVIGVAVQVLIGSLSFLLPMAIGRGPARVRANTATLDSWRVVRLTVLNAGVTMTGLGGLMQSASTLRVGMVLSGVAVFAFICLVVVVLVRHLQLTRQTRPTEC